MHRVFCPAPTALSCALALTCPQELREAVLLPMRFPQLFTGIRRPQCNLLFHGAPGTGGRPLTTRTQPALGSAGPLCSTQRQCRPARLAAACIAAWERSLCVVVCSPNQRCSCKKILVPLPSALLSGMAAGKTMLVEKLAAEAGTPLLCLSPAATLSKWAGESEKRLRAAFQAAAALSPAILFIDEVDSLAPARWGPVCQACALAGGKEWRWPVIRRPPRSPPWLPSRALHPAAAAAAAATCAGPAATTCRRAACSPSC